MCLFVVLVDPTAEIGLKLLGSLYIYQKKDIEVYIIRGGKYLFGTSNSGLQLWYRSYSQQGVFVGPYL